MTGEASLARYFFDFHDGEVRRDAQGTECAGPEDVRREVLNTLPEIARPRIPKGGGNQAFTVVVRNENNVPVYVATLTFAGAWMGEAVPTVEEPIE
ncbi:DUF6894 family protein [Methylobacterium thuringiense]|uniref:DUF6894 family protein n=1 Tax=Methylobacterium thuringiense TaxID=1003091 RepID=UPI003570D28D